MSKNYKHLTYEQRCQIFILKERGEIPARIAEALNVDRSTIIREIRRNGDIKGYDPEEAEKKAKERRCQTPNKKMNEELLAIVTEKLLQDWSPEQIAGWLRKESNCVISHETIYRYVLIDKENGGFLYKHLRHKGKKYNKRSKGQAGRGCIPNRIDIKDRPLIVEEKSRFGDWELDTIIGANHKGVLVSMVDRASKLLKLVKVPNKEASEVTRAIVKALDPMKNHTHTLTADNGKEFARHLEISRALEASFYFATPYHSWERGLNEHTNGLVRQYFPKGTQFDEVTDEDVAVVEFKINNRPRKTLSFQSPTEVFQCLTSTFCE